MNKEKKKNDISVKIFSLLIAILMWSYVMNEVNPEIVREYRNISAEFSNVDSLDKEGLRLMSPQESKISVKVAGKKSEMDKFSAKNIKALIDLSGYKEGQMKVPVRVSLENQMNSIQITDYEPKEVMVTFDKFITVEKNITVRTIGELEPSYVLDSIEIQPETVLLKGPRSYIKDIAEIIAYIDLEGRKTNESTTAQIRILNDQGNDLIGIERDPKNVSAKIQVKRSKEVAIRPRFNQELPEGVDLSDILVSPSKIKLKGDEKVLDLGYIDTSEIDLDRLMDKKTLRVELITPEGIEKLMPKEQVTISLNEKNSIERTLKLENQPIEVRNLKEGLTPLTALEEDIQLVLVGDNLEKLKPSDFKAYVDLKDLDQGNYDLDIKLDLPPGVELVNYGPKTVKVKLINS